MVTRKISGGELGLYIDGENVLSIKETVSDAVMYIKLKGEIFQEISNDFEDEIMAAYCACKQLVIDLSEVTYMASQAMAVLLSVQQIVDEDEEALLKFVNLSEEISVIFDDVGLTDVLYIE